MGWDAFLESFCHFAVFIFLWLLGVWEWSLPGASGDTNEIGGSYWDHLNYGGLLLFPS
jgi:hypothetical protein